MWCSCPKNKIHGKPRVPTVENVRRSCASLPLAIQLAARLLTTAGATASHYATREVVGDEGAHEAERVADLVLRLVRLHHGEVSLCALDRLVGRFIIE